MSRKLEVFTCMHATDMRSKTSGSKSNVVVFHGVLMLRLTKNYQKLFRLFLTTWHATRRFVHVRLRALHMLLLQYAPHRHPPFQCRRMSMSKLPQFSAQVVRKQENS